MRGQQREHLCSGCTEWESERHTALNTHLCFSQLVPNCFKLPRKCTRWRHGREIMSFYFQTVQEDLDNKPRLLQQIVFIALISYMIDVSEEGDEAWVIWGTRDELMMPVSVICVWCCGNRNKLASSCAIFSAGLTGKRKSPGSVNDLMQWYWKRSWLKEVRMTFFLFHQKTKTTNVMLVERDDARWR